MIAIVLILFAVIIALVVIGMFAGPILIVCLIMLAVWLIHHII